MVIEPVAAVWRELAAARTLVLATRGDDGAPRLRTVVPRGVDMAARRVRFYTDARSTKVAEIAAEPRVALLGWDAEARVQLRLDGRAGAAGPAETEAAWSGLHPGAYPDYATRLPPGSPAAGGGVEHGPAAAARANFAVFDVTVAAIDRLRLDPGGHERVRWTWAAGGWSAVPLVP